MSLPIQPHFSSEQASPKRPCLRSRMGKQRTGVCFTRACGSAWGRPSSSGSFGTSLSTPSSAKWTSTGKMWCSCTAAWRATSCSLGAGGSLSICGQAFESILCQFLSTIGYLFCLLNHGLFPLQISFRAGCSTYNGPYVHLEGRFVAISAICRFLCLCHLPLPFYPLSVNPVSTLSTPPPTSSPALQP